MCIRDRFRLVQASSHAPGKNTTDIALVIDAMDILRDGRADCFCLVASDGDYSLLAQRIREAGLKVLGYGEDKTPVSLVRSCSCLLYTSDAADEEDSVDLGGRHILKKKNTHNAPTYHAA